MNVTVEDLAPCKKLVRVEVEAEKVDETFETITKDFERRTAFPGFRPGKAPRAMVLRKFEKEIQDEVKRKLISDSYKKAIDDQKLDVLGYPDIEEIQFNRGQPLQFAATIETSPQFELPAYKDLPVKREARTVTAEDVERALEALRQTQVSYKNVERPLQLGCRAAPRPVVFQHRTAEPRRIRRALLRAAGVEGRRAGSRGAARAHRRRHPGRGGGGMRAHGRAGPQFVPGGRPGAERAPGGGAREPFSGNASGPGCGAEIVDHHLLLPVDPACRDGEEELPGVEDEIHGWSDERMGPYGDGAGRSRQDVACPDRAR